MTLGGEDGHRVAKRLCLKVSSDILLRMAKCSIQPEQAAPRVKRVDLYRRIEGLKAEGKSQRSIAFKLGIDGETANRFYQATELPEREIGRRGGQATPFLNEIAKPWDEGCRNAQTLTTKVAALGYHGSYDSIRRLVARWRVPSSKPGEQDKGSARARAIPMHSASRVAWLLFLNPQISMRRTNDYPNRFKSIAPNCVKPQT